MKCLLLLSEDPYYSGLRARIPNFVRSRVSSAMNGAKGKVRRKDSRKSRKSDQSLENRLKNQFAFAGPR